VQDKYNVVGFVENLRVPKGEGSSELKAAMTREVEPVYSMFAMLWPRDWIALQRA